MCDKQKIYMCTQTFCNNTLNFKGKQNDDIQAKGCFLATELLTSFFFFRKCQKIFANYIEIWIDIIPKIILVHGVVKSK